MLISSTPLTISDRRLIPIVALILCLEGVLITAFGDPIIEETAPPTSDAPISAVAVDPASR